MSRLLTVRVLGLASVLVVAILVGFGAWAAFADRWSLVAIALLLGQSLLVGFGLLLLNRTLVQVREARRDAKRLREVQERTRKISRVQGGGLDVSMPSIESALDRHLTLVKDQVHNEIGIISSELRQHDAVLRRLHATSALGGTDGESDRSSIAERLVAHERSTHRALRQVERRLDKLGQFSVRETDALLQVHRRTDELGLRPLLGGWALSPSAVLQLLELVERLQPQLVVECGSGASTVYLAGALRRLGKSSRLIALEHDERFALQTRQALERSGLSDVADVRHAPLEPLEIGDWSGQWYQLRALGELSSIELLLVDGPPEGTGALARFPALPVMRSKLASNAVIVLDDSRRDDERAILKSWLKDSEISRATSQTDDQAVLTMADPSARLS